MTAAHPLPPAADDLEVIVVTRDGIEGIVLDPEEEAETVRREAEIPAGAQTAPRRMRAYAVGRHPSFDRDFRKQIEWWMARSPARAEVIARAEAIVDALEAASRRLSEFPEIGPPSKSAAVGS